MEYIYLCNEQIVFHLYFLFDKITTQPKNNNNNKRE